MKRWSILTLIVMIALIMTSCSSPATPTPAPKPAATQAPAPTKAPVVEPTKAPAVEPTKAPAAPAAIDPAAAAKANGLTELADAYAGKYKGTKVTMSGPFTDEDAVKFNNSMKDFSTKTGITIQYSSLE